MNRKFPPDLLHPLHARRTSRPLLPGEPLPRVPCMIEQILSFFADLEHVTLLPIVDLEHDEDDLHFLLEFAT